MKKKIKKMRKKKAIAGEKERNGFEASDDLNRRNELSCPKHILVHYRVRA